MIWNGNNNNGSLIGGAGWTEEGKNGNGLLIANDYQYVRVLDSTALDYTDKFSISIDFKASLLDGAARGLVSKELVLLI